MTNATGTPSHIQIYRGPSGYRVRPATHATGRGQTVVFFNAGPAAVSLLFPDPIFRDAGHGPVVISAGDSESLIVLSDIALRAYPYAVFANESNGFRDFAKGDSAPVIIIDR